MVIWCLFFFSLHLTNKLKREDRLGFRLPHCSNKIKIYMHLMPCYDSMMLSLGISTGKGINSVALIYQCTINRYIPFAFGKLWWMKSYQSLLVVIWSFSADVSEEVIFTKLRILIGGHWKLHISKVFLL